jgi:hypothetical protein
MSTEFGPQCVKPSSYVGLALEQDIVDPGILGRPLATGNTTLTAKASNNAQPGLNESLNAAKDRAQRAGTGR